MGGEESGHVGGLAGLWSGGTEERPRIEHLLSDYCRSGVSNFPCFMIKMQYMSYSGKGDLQTLKL